LLCSDKCTILKRIEFTVKKNYFEGQVENNRNVGIRSVKREKTIVKRQVFERKIAFLKCTMP
jgi:hypothetical protein